MGDLAVARLDDQLGTMTDWALSQKAGLHVVDVYNRRELLGIPAFGGTSRSGCATCGKGRGEDIGTTTPQRVYWTPEMDAALGKTPDWWVAYKLGLREGQIRARRHWLGAPSWVERHRVLPKGVKYWSKEAERIHNVRRRHRKAGLPDTLTQGQWEFATEFFEGRCAYCGRQAALTEDHIVPLSQGGGRVALNILPACKPCNSSKHTMQAYLWIRSRFSFSPQRAQAVEAKILEYLALVKLREQSY